MGSMTASRARKPLPTGYRRSRSQSRACARIKLLVGPSTSRVRQAEPYNIGRRLQPALVSSADGSCHDRSRLFLDCGKLPWAAEGLGIELVDVFRAGRPGGEPA